MRVTILRGLPGSGKTTMAKSIVSDGSGQVKLVSRDSLRGMLENSRFYEENERLIDRIVSHTIAECLTEGKDVIVDDTNLNAHNVQVVYDAVKKFTKDTGKFVNMDIVEMNTSLDVCIERDMNRPNPCGAKKIVDMYLEHYAQRGDAM